jgi:hypothetical protein
VQVDPLPSAVAKNATVGGGWRRGTLAVARWSANDTSDAAAARTSTSICCGAHAAQAPEVGGRGRLRRQHGRRGSPARRGGGKIGSRWGWRSGAAGRPPASAGGPSQRARERGRLLDRGGRRH